MKRLLVVDDERPVVDHIVRTVERELAEEFVVVGTASSGREALEKVPGTQPDIVVMDVRMPGLSGLDTIRELKRRGNAAVFLLSTAYERFDIAKEALELGITSYLLKPVLKEVLVQALRTAAEQFERIKEAELQAYAFRERDRRIRNLVTETFLGGIMLGWNTPEACQAFGDWLGIEKPWALVVAVAFNDRAQDRRNLLESTLQYKTNALCGPLILGRCLVYWPLGSPGEALAAQNTLLETLGMLQADDKVESFNVGFAEPRRLDGVVLAWGEAEGRLHGDHHDLSLQETEPFLLSLSDADPDQARSAFEALLTSYENSALVPMAERYRLVSLLGTVLGRLLGKGQADPTLAHLWADFDDLEHAASGREFCLFLRARLATVAAAVKRASRWSAPLTGALDLISQNYGQALTLDLVAEHVNLTPKRLSRLFIEELGQGFSDYLIDFRIEKAKVLLLLPQASIKQVAAECGYPDPNYFARLFKKVTGTTPTEFSTALGNGEIIVP